jgi:hypothetical protein
MMRARGYPPPIQIEGSQDAFDVLYKFASRDLERGGLTNVEADKESADCARQCRALLLDFLAA